MENLHIEGSKDVYFVPSVFFNTNTGECEISGESYLEETEKFYEPLIQWIETYIAKVKKPITFNIKLTYYNTNSSRSILEMLDILKMYEEDGGQVTVNWYCDEEDLLNVEDEVEDYRIQTELNINLITYSS